MAQLRWPTAAARRKFLAFSGAPLSGQTPTMSEAASHPVPAAEPWLKVTFSPGLPHWLAEHQVSLACTTYQTGKLLLFGRKPDEGLAVFERNFSRCMGL